LADRLASSDRLGAPSAARAVGKGTDVKFEWTSRAGAGLALVWALLAGGCGVERNPAPEPPSLAPPATAPLPPPEPAKVTVMSGGRLRVEAPLTDVATLQRQPDGSYRRVCGAPSPEQRAMLQAVLRARRAAK
jgi:hypothetical protein